jgi:hypothetical protein
MISKIRSTLETHDVDFTALCIAGITGGPGNGVGVVHQDRYIGCLSPRRKTDTEFGIFIESPCHFIAMQ